MTEQNVLLEDMCTRPGMDRDGNMVEVQVTKYLICLSDGLRYGLDAEQVVEIITDHTITPLPCVPEYVRGVINLRGQIIPVIDLRLRPLLCQCHNSLSYLLLFFLLLIFNPYPFIYHNTKQKPHIFILKKSYVHNETNKHLM